VTADQVGYVIAACMGVWMAGYGVGQAVAWVRKLRDVV
jgi:hypothetical protein